MQALRDRELRLKHAAESSEHILRIRRQKEGFEELIKATRPKWMIFKEKFNKTLRKAE